MLEALANWVALNISEEASTWFQYFTNGKHLAWYASVRFTVFAALFGALLAVLFGVLGAAARRSGFAPLRWLGLTYTTMVRGIPDVLFFLFFPLAFEQTVEFVMSRKLCTAAELASATSWPPCQAAQWYLSTTEYFVMACVSLGIVYGAFAANVVHGAMMQIADIVQWADRLGAPNYFARAGMVHPDWRWKYYFVLFLFYILLTVISERVFEWLQRRAGRGLALHENP